MANAAKVPTVYDNAYKMTVDAIEAAETALESIDKIHAALQGGLNSHHTGDCFRHMSRRTIGMAFNEQIDRLSNDRPDVASAVKTALEDHKDRVEKLKFW